MRIFITGSSGLVGQHLIPHLEERGHEIVRMVRRQSDVASAKAHNEKAIVWKPNAARINAAELEGADVVVHLAGESIAKRWTERRKQTIRDSRITGTQTLARALASLGRRPHTLVCASAVGYYGDRGDEVLTEDSPPGSGFAAQLCVDWEAACEPAREAGIRVVNLRFGLIFSPRGGALGQMLLPFKLGIAGVIGSGRQYWPWVAIDDAVGVIDFLLTSDHAGPINVVAPQQVTNREFTKTLGRVLHRPTVLPMPAFAAKLAFGRQFAREGLLASERVEPRRLLDAGYRFQFPQLEEAMRHLLG